ncbi:MAG: hypothetical protein ACK4RG_01605 [Fimbriimonadales bacterium]
MCIHSVGVPADEQRLDTNVQATQARVRRLSWRRNAPPPTNRAWTRMSQPHLLSVGVLADE